MMYKKLTTFVISAHLVTLLFLLFSPVKKPPKAHKHVAVRTLQPKPQPMTMVSAPKKTTAPIQKKSTVVAKNKPTPPVKNRSEKTSIIKPRQNAKTEIVKEQPSSSKISTLKAWKEIDEALAKIDKKVYPSSKSTLDVPQIDIPPLGCEESLVSFLHSSLNLPEFGEVTIQLTIKKDGSVARLVVMKAESIKNKTYLEQNLPMLRFPLILENEKTFTLTFCNEI